MLRRSSITLALFIFLCSTLPAQVQQPAGAANNTLSSAETAAGWTLLFDGRTLSGLNSVGDSDWKVEDEALTATKGTGYLVTPKQYTNFELQGRLLDEQDRQQRRVRALRRGNSRSHDLLRTPDRGPGHRHARERRAIASRHAGLHGEMEHLRSQGRRKPSDREARTARRRPTFRTNGWPPGDDRVARGRTGRVRAGQVSQRQASAALV